MLFLNMVCLTLAFAVKEVREGQCVGGGYVRYSPCSAPPVSLLRSWAVLDGSRLRGGLPGRVLGEHDCRGSGGVGSASAQDPSDQGEFHDRADAKWIAIRGLSWGHKDTPCGRAISGRPIGRHGVGRP
jgi:hypothetical protein